MPARRRPLGSAAPQTIALAVAFLLAAACAEGPPMRDPTLGEVSGTTLLGISAASVVGGPLALGAAAAVGSTFVDPDTRVSEILSGGQYRHRPRPCQTLRDCVFSGRH